MMFHSTSLPSASEVEQLGFTELWYIYLMDKSSLLIYSFTCSPLLFKCVALLAVSLQMLTHYWTKAELFSICVDEKSYIEIWTGGHQKQAKECPRQLGLPSMLVHIRVRWGGSSIGFGCFLGASLLEDTLAQIKSWICALGVSVFSVLGITWRSFRELLARGMSGSSSWSCCPHNPTMDKQQKREEINKCLNEKTAWRTEQVSHD